jgi:lysyl-tRNA synthetase class II
MNRAIFVLKLKNEPKQNFYKNRIKYIRINAIFGFLKRKDTPRFCKLKLEIWGNLTDDIIKYYKKGDYIIVKGRLHITQSRWSNKRPIFRLTVLKIYPLFNS